MAKKDLSDFNSDSEPEEDDSSEKSIEEEEEKPRNMAKQVVPDYEKQRQSRMAQNRARMKALGLHTMAASLMAASPQKSSHSRISDDKRKGKRKLVDEDDDYKPNDDATAEDQDDDDDDDDDDEDEDEEDDEFSCTSTAKSRRKKPQKNKGTKPKSKLPLKKHSRGKDYINEDYDDDDELMKAISLSLQDLPEKENANSRDGAARKKKQFNSRAKMTEDELILHFFQFDESGKGFLTVRDLERVSAAHDFTWTDEELADMVRCFDSDGDGKLNLDDFRKIAGRCNMI